MELEKQLKLRHVTNRVVQNGPNGANGLNALSLVEEGKRVDPDSARLAMIC